MEVVDQRKRLKLDAIDRKLFWYLSQNIRMPKNILAKNLRISPSKLHYRMNRLEKEGIIIPSTILNLPLLGISSYFIFTGRLKEETAQQLIAAKESFTVMRVVGQYQYVIHTVTNEIEKYCKGYLSNIQFEIHQAIAMHPDNFNCFHVPFKGKPLRETKEVRQISLDARDYALLYAVSLSPTAPLLRLSRETGMDRATVKKRLRALEDANIIQFFRTATDIFKLGFLSYILHIKASPGDKRALLHLIHEDHYSGFVYETLTGFICYYVPEHHADLFAFIRSLENARPSIKINVIQNVDFYTISSTPRVVLEWLESRGMST